MVQVAIGVTGPDFFEPSASWKKLLAGAQIILLDYPKSVLMSLDQPGFNMHVKPSVEVIRRMAHAHELRGIIAGDQLLIWDAFDAVHQQITDTLGIPSGYIRLMAERRRSAAKSERRLYNDGLIMPAFREPKGLSNSFPDRIFLKLKAAFAGRASDF